MYFLKNFSSAFFKRRYIYIYVCIIYIYAKAPNNTLIETSIFIIPTPNMKKLWETADTVQCSQLGPVLFLWCFGWRTTAPGVVSVSAVQQHDSAVPPSLLSLCPAPPRPSRHAPGWAACHTAASRQLWVSHEVVHTRQCCATRFAPPPSPPGRVQSAHVRLFCTLLSRDAPMVVCKRVGERCAQTCFPRGAARPGAGLPARGLRRARGPASLPRHRGSASSPGETSAASGEKRDVEAAPACLASRARRAGTRGSLAPRGRVLASRLHTVGEMLSVCGRHVRGEG